MSNPKELWEDTHMAQRAYPIQFFPNRPQSKKAGDCVLYLHWHVHMEVIMVRKGKALFYIDSQPIEADEGDIVFVPGGSLHVGYSRSETQVELDCIVFNAALFHEWLNDAIHVKLLAHYLEGEEHFPLLLSYLPNFTQQLQLEFEGIVKELECKEAGYQLIVKAKLYAWLIKLARLNSKHSARYMQEPYFANRAEKPTVKQAANMVGLDHFYFCKQFKKLTGRTFVEFVNVCRITKAEEMLKHSEATVGEIANAIGCENAAYFTKLYKQYTGMTPSEARKVLQ
jgi:AraC family transcriptional activator of pobA